MSEPIRCIVVKCKNLYHSAKLPHRAHSTDAGHDLYLHHTEELDNGAIMHCSGIAVEIPYGYFGLLRPRSSLAKSQFVMCSSGVIDCGYRGELKLPLKCLGKGTIYVNGDRFAQLLILPLPHVTYELAEELSDSPRGAGGFGSTGT